MNLNIAATKTNLLKVKRSLALTKEGYELLDEKRKILINELNSVIDIANKIERDLEQKLRGAYASLDRAIISMGRSNVDSLARTIDTANELSIAYRRVMGVDIPVIGLKITDNPPHHSPHGVSLYVDETIAGFKEVMRILASLAEKRIALLRIAEEVFKTIKKVNALEKIYIPDYTDTLKCIGERLDEEGREAFVILKIIKSRLKRSG